MEKSGEVERYSASCRRFVTISKRVCFYRHFGTLSEGKADKRVIIDAYGIGRKPCIKAPDASLYTILVQNSDYLTLQNLEVVNTGTERLAHRTGVKVLCENYGVSHNIILNALEIHDVNGSLIKQKGGGSGILIVNKGQDVISTFDGLTIENCIIRRCERNGMIWSSYSSRNNWHPVPILLFVKPDRRSSR